MKVISTLLVFASFTFAQEATLPSLPREQPKTQFKVDCLGVEATTSCHSYNELVESNDKDVIGSLGGLYDTYVCFSTDDDTFSMVSVSPYWEPAYHKAIKSPRILEQDGQVTFSGYKNGQTDEFKVAEGKWRRAATLQNDIFRTDDGAEPAAFVDDYTVSFQYSYQNTQGRKLTYAISIRRSTKRFTETWDAPAIPEKKQESIRIVSTGHCAEFK
ncbi:MAG TPA: hypothetical protein VK763_02605 [Terriglobales bacterium]|jgi:hypothetical protein|nr:hypothetical protein [Terriglobales bacterium]